MDHIMLSPDTCVEDLNNIFERPPDDMMRFYLLHELTLKYESFQELLNVTLGFLDIGPPSAARLLQVGEKLALIEDKLIAKVPNSRDRVAAIRNVKECKELEGLRRMVIENWCNEGLGTDLLHEGIEELDRASDFLKGIIGLECARNGKELKSKLVANLSSRQDDSCVPF